MPQLEHIEAIEKRLWAAADKYGELEEQATSKDFLAVRHEDKRQGGRYE